MSNVTCKDVGRTTKVEHKRIYEFCGEETVFIFLYVYISFTSIYFFHNMKHFLNKVFLNKVNRNIFISTKLINILEISSI